MSSEPSIAACLLTLEAPSLFPQEACSRPESACRFLLGSAPDGNTVQVETTENAYTVA